MLWAVGLMGFLAMLYEESRDGGLKAGNNACTLLLMAVGEPCKSVQYASYIVIMNCGMSHLMAGSKARSAGPA